MAFLKTIFTYICIYNLLLCNDTGRNLVLAKYGGQDLFTSLAQLEVLWNNDIKVVNQMEGMITKMETALAALKMYELTRSISRHNV